MPATWADGANLYTASCTSIDFDLPTYTVDVSINGGSPVARTLSYPAFPECDFATVSEDLMDLFYIGVAFIVVVVLARLLFNVFVPSRRSDDPL